MLFLCTASAPVAMFAYSVNLYSIFRKENMSPPISTNVTEKKTETKEPDLHMKNLPTNYELSIVTFVLEIVAYT